MSKAFTRESDDIPEQPLLTQRSPLPFGVKNYITPQGAQRLRKELDRLIEIERPGLANSPEGSDSRRELLLLDQRIATLGQCLQSTVIVEPPTGPEEQVRFGATVTVREKAGAESTYRLVGVDETDMDRNWVSWRSPLARALLNARRGDRVRFRTPVGEEELQIIHVSYE